MSIQTITLTAAGINSGPSYDVYWSADCVNYSLLTGSSPVFLPIVGATASLDVPDTVQCLRLVNNNEDCDNAVTKNVALCPTTSTTSTTLAPTTSTTTVVPTTTTTTAAPTTTTTATPTTSTTTTAAPCLCYYIQNETAGLLYYEYIDCSTGYQNLPLSGGGIVRVCSADYPSGVGLTIIPCTDITICNTSSDCTGCGFNPTTTTTEAPPPTTTVAPTTTTTQCPCVQTVVLNVTEAGTFDFTDCCGTPRSTNVGTGEQIVDYSTDGCINVNTFAGSAQYTVVSYGSCCTPTCPTTTTTVAPTTTTIAPTTTTVAPTTTTVAPTTTTTQPPTVYEVELCGGGLGPFLVTLGSGDTPAGIGQAFKISGNSGAGFNGINCWTVLQNPATGTPDYTNLAFGSVFSNCESCVPTTTTTTIAPTTTTLSPTTTTLAPTTTTLSPTTTVAPTTTTAAPTTTTTLSGFCFTGDEFTCSNGNCVAGTTNVALRDVSNEPNVGSYYLDTISGKIYLVTEKVKCVGTRTLVNLTNESAVCSELCPQPTTTTLSPTTTTLSPTTTTVAPTTTTLAPTTTTTTQACVTSVSFEVDSAGDVRYVDCCGNTIYLTFGIGPQVINDCLQNGSLFGVGATISFITYGSTGCNCVTTTTTLTPTTTTVAPTTTTTIAPTTTTTTATSVDIYITNSSLDIPITDMTINGVSVTWVSGGDGFPVNSGENGNFTSTQLGTQNVVIYYGGHISGQNITFTDSNSNVDCQNLNGGAGSFTIASATITGGTTIYVNATDGACV